MDLLGALLVFSAATFDVLEMNDVGCRTNFVKRLAMAAVAGVCSVNCATIHLRAVLD